MRLKAFALRRACSGRVRLPAPFLALGVTLALLALLPLPSAAQEGPAWSADERESVELSFIALAGCENADPARVAAAVAGLAAEMLPREEIVWGPAVHMPARKNGGLASGLSDALVFITKDRDSGGYSVVFRGTNTVSAAEWILQDFMVQAQVPWRATVALPATIDRSGAIDGLVPVDALVSEGTATAMSIRLGLAPDPGLPGEGRNLAEALLAIAEDSGSSRQIRFTGHSLGGLLAPVAALWLLDRLEAEGRGGLAASLDLDIRAFAGPTPGNAPFARHLESRVRGLARYVNALDIAPRAWEDEAMAALPDLYRPAIGMQPITWSVYGICAAMARGKGYGQPGPAIDVPSRVVPAKAGLYLLEAAWQHMVPYLEMLEPEREGRIIRDVIEPIAASVSVKGLKPIDLASLYSSGD